MLFNLFSKRNELVKFNQLPQNDAYFSAAIAHYNETLQQYNEQYGFTQHEEWGFDQETGEFVLKDNGETVVKATGQILGSYSTLAKTWEWAWNNPNCEPTMTTLSEQVKAYGEKKDIDYLCEGMLSVPNIQFAAYLATIGQRVSNSEVVYCGVTGGLAIFIALNDFVQLNEKIAENHIDTQLF